MEELIALFESYTGRKNPVCVKLAGEGSNRCYFRLKEGDFSLIGVKGENVPENDAFIAISDHFSKKGLPVPKVVAVAEDRLFYLQEDLGDLSLFSFISHGVSTGDFSKEEEAMLLKTISVLPDLQFKGADGLDFSVCYPQPSFDRRSIMWDLNYFKYMFLKPLHIDFSEPKLEDDFERIATDLLEDASETFLYRDFQSRNVMIKEGEPFFIDFQGGRRGPVQYDVASFLWQASAHYSQALRQELINTYITSLKQYVEVNELQFRQNLKLCILFRLLQVLGAYGFRGYFERKKHFLESIPPAIQNLRELLEDGGCPYPYMREVLSQLVELPQFVAKPEKPVQRSDGYKTTDNNPYVSHPKDGPATFSRYDGKGPLVVRVFSFSFGKGIPADTSGNGGGYVFDCRSTHNPGRYEPYKKLTGLDEPVIRFLEDDGEILTFLDSVYKLADAHVQRYLQRGFTDLMFCFGCTGGQHRSVYSAQHLAEHINQKFGIEVRLCHREQGISQTFQNKDET